MSELGGIDIRVGTVMAASLHPRSRVPAIVMTIDFGPVLGRRSSSAQLTGNYEPGNLVGTQVLAVVNLGPRLVAGVKSEALVLGAICPEQGTVLLRPMGRIREGASVGVE